VSGHGRPRRTIRLRLAALLATTFFLFSGSLLAISYALVSSNLTADPREITREIEATARFDAPKLGSRETLYELFREVQEERARQDLNQLTAQYLALLALLTALSGGLGWYFAGRVLRPMAEITATARRVSQQSLDQRIGLQGPADELKELADTFDAMLERLEAGFDRQAAFIRNASHELRTPLAVIQAETDVTLAEERDDPNALRNALAVVRSASARSERLVSALLALAQADSAEWPRKRVDLTALCRELSRVGAIGKLSTYISLDEAAVAGDQELLATMVSNLIDNAVRHNVDNGWIEVRLVQGEQVRLQVSNAGPVLDEEAVDRLAEPFRRLAVARTGEGLGLGLSIAKAVAGMHGGRLLLEPLPGGGLRATVELPTWRESESPGLEEEPRASIRRS
jgi:signal transduction histidine kinase